MTVIATRSGTASWAHRSSAWPLLGAALAVACALATGCGAGDPDEGDDPPDPSLLRAEALATAVEQSALVLHLETLEALAHANAEQPGIRPRAATREWARGALEAARYDVIEQHFAPLDPACGEPCTGINLVATWPDEPEGLAVLITAHYDLVNGPGINDNGAGVAAVVEVATRAALLGIADEVPLRFTLLDREETGSPYGAKAFLSGLSRVPPTPGPGPVVWGLLGAVNLDMIGSLNGVPGRVVYAEPVGSMVIADALDGWFARDGASMVTWPIEDIHAQRYYLDSDAFSAMGVPVTTAFAGAAALKSAEEAELYGGAASERYCTCNHAPCDGAQNVDPARMTELTRAAAWAVGRLAGRRRLQD